MLEVRAGSYGVLVLFPLKTATLTSVLDRDFPYGQSPSPKGNPNEMVAS